MNKDFLKLANVEGIRSSKSLQGANAGNRSCFIKSVFKNFTKLTGNSFWLELSFNKNCRNEHSRSIKIESSPHVFSCEFYAVFKKPILQNVCKGLLRNMSDILAYQLSLVMTYGFMVNFSTYVKDTKRPFTNRNVYRDICIEQLLVSKLSFQLTTKKNLYFV